MSNEHRIVMVDKEVADLIELLQKDLDRNAIALDEIGEWMARLAPAVTAMRARLDEETRRANSSEQELRETAGELELLRANFRSLDLDAPMAAQIRLTEATALLERVRDYPSEPRSMSDSTRLESDIDAFLYRAPAQPAAPVLCHPTGPCAHGITGPCSKCQRPNDGRSGRCGIRVSGDHWCVLDYQHPGEHSKRAAPTPDPTLYAQVGSDDDRVWIPASVAQHIEKAGFRIVPAAPEPSVCARFSGCEGSGYATILGTGGDAAPCEECKLGKVYKRAEAAEARLAAVREAIRVHDVGVGTKGGPDWEGLPGSPTTVARIRSLLSAPTGEGDKT